MPAAIEEAAQVRLRLLDFEGSMFLMQEVGVTTVTFYRGSFAAGSAAVRSWLLALLRANPWLAGRMERAKGGVDLVHPHSSAVDDAVTVASVWGDPGAATLSPHMNFGTLVKALKRAGAVLPSGSSVLSSRSVVSRLTVFASPAEAGGEGEGFAVAFSLSHNVGDGYTHYAILTQLRGAGGAFASGQAPPHVKALNAERKHAAEALNDAAAPGDKGYMSSLGIMGNMMTTILCSRPRVPAQAFYIDEAAIRSAKEGAKSVNAVRDGKPVPFLSTNDVLTSHFGRTVGLDIVMMPINWRGKVQGGGTEDDAGNYESVLMLDEATFAQPTDLRRSLLDGPPVLRASRSGGGQTPLPGCCQTCCSVRLGMITSWASFFDGDLGLGADAFEQLLHVPVYDPYSMESAVPLAVVFRPQPGRTAVMYLGLGTSRTSREELLASTGSLRSPLGQEVSAEMFGR